MSVAALTVFGGVSLHAGLSGSEEIRLSIDRERVYVVEMTAGTPTIKLPKATAIFSEGGWIFLVVNVGAGANDIPIKDDGDTTVHTSNANSATFIHLTDNTTANGSWRFVDYSTSTTA